MAMDVLPLAEELLQLVMDLVLALRLAHRKLTELPPRGMKLCLLRLQHRPS
jgi:hypothetical protein